MEDDAPRSSESSVSDPVEKAGVNDFEQWAEYYDEQYHEKFAESEDEAFYCDLVDQSEEPALEIACGTGRLLIPFLEAGHDVHGADISEGMLDRLREKAGDDLSPTLFHGDAATLSYPHEYGLIYIPFTAIAHFRTLEHQKKLFENAHNHLSDGGAFAFDTFVPDFNKVANEYGNIDSVEFRRDGRTYRWETWSELVDPVEQEVRMHNRVFDLAAEQPTVVWQTSFELAFLPKQQIELLFENAGFSEWEFRDGFSEEEVDEETDRIACIGWK